VGKGQAELAHPVNVCFHEQKCNGNCGGLEGSVES